MQGFRLHDKNMPSCTQIEFLRIKGKMQDEYIPSFDKLLIIGSFYWETSEKAMIWECHDFC